MIKLMMALLTSVAAVHAQLAVTENLSSASLTNSLGAEQGPDFWELSNFGGGPIDLTGYRWNDGDGGLAGADSAPFIGVTIGPGETILFVQNNVPEVSTPEAFRSWWGLPPTQQVVFFSGNGQSSGGDSIILWGPDAVDDSDVLDRADFGAAPDNFGHTFTYNPANGVYGIFSTNGVGGAFTAALSADVGSPGTNSGPVPLTIIQHPTNTTGYVGFAVTFQAAAQGLPRGRFQWRFNGTPLNAFGPTLTIPNVQTNDAGEYSVIVTNGLETLISSNAVLTVDASPASPVFTVEPSGIEAYIGQSITLTAAAQGNPPPACQWQRNGVDLTGETASQLALSNLQTNDTGLYSVVARNVVGTNTASAMVIVTAKPRLVISEVHSTGNSAGFNDWWELTNLDDRSINLRGYRFDDSSAAFASAWTITNDIALRPGESAVLLLLPITDAQFRAWWGESNLPPQLQIISYPDNGLGLGSGGDGMVLWNAAATVESDFVASVTFGAAPSAPRRSFVRDPDNPTMQAPFAGSLNQNATNGVNGAFTASTGDVGSPGWIVSPLILNIASEPAGAVIAWNSAAGRSYIVDYKDGIAASTWNVLTNIIADGSTAAVTDPATVSNRFYRLRLTLPVP